MINNNFSATEWNNFPLFSLSCLAYSFTSKNCFVAGDVTNVLTSSPKLSMHSSIFSTISTFIVLFFIYIFIPKKVCYFPLTKDSSPNFFFTSFIISDITSGFLYNNLLSSTYQAMVHCVPSTTLFATHLE